jgi:hypothetical protein
MRMIQRKPAMAAAREHPSLSDWMVRLRAP